MLLIKLLYSFKNPGKLGSRRVARTASTVPFGEMAGKPCFSLPVFRGLTTAFGFSPYRDRGSCHASSVLLLLFDERNGLGNEVGSNAVSDSEHLQVLPL